MVVLWAEQAVACGRMALEHFNDPQDRELILAATWMRAIGQVSRPTAAPVHRSEIATATAIFREAFGEVPPPHRGSSVLNHPNTYHLRYALAVNSPLYKLLPLSWEMRRRLQKLLMRA
jgi:hypothetical protein